MQTVLSRLVVIAALALFVCCKSNDPVMESADGAAEQTPLSEDIPSDRAVGEFVSAFCAYRARCLPYGLVDEGLSMASCATDALASFWKNDVFVKRFESVAAGTVTYRGDLMSACVKELLQVSCDQPLSLQSADLCRGAFVGTVPRGGMCISSYDCAPEDMCVDGASNDLVCAGTCQAKKAAGEPCVRPDECISGHVCSDDDVCVAKVGLGAACNPLQDLVCASPFICDGPSGQARSCVSAPALQTAIAGQSCNYGSLLASAPAYCRPGLVCSTVGREASNLPILQCRAKAALGMPCSPVGATTPCMEGLCVSGVSNADQGVCTSLPAIGQPCLRSSPNQISPGRCVPGAVCVGSTCVTPIENGQPCSLNEECVSQSCRETPSGGGKTCSPSASCG